MNSRMSSRSKSPPFAMSSNRRARNAFDCSGLRSAACNSFFHRPFGSSFTLSAKKQKTSWLTKCATASRSGLRCCSESEIVWNLSAASLVSLARVRPERSSSGIVEDGAKTSEVDRLGEVVELELVFRRDFVGPARLDAEDVRVAGDMQRRVFERGGVAGQLFERLVEIALLLLVFPGEKALLPDVRPAFAAAGLRRAFLEGEMVADRVVLGRASGGRTGGRGR